MKRYRYFVVSLVAMLFVASISRSVYSLGQAVPVLADIAPLPVIVIDPGHGGMDGGAVGADKIVEKDINLAISLCMRDMFVASGFQVVMTRETDISIHDEGVTGTRKQKVSDLHNRLNLVNQYPGGVFISIHQNKFGDSRSQGAQVFYGPQNEQSEKLADILQKNFVEDLQPNNNRKYKKAGKNLYLMYNAQYPSVLLECGFLSNPQEAHQLIDPDYQSKVAFTAYRSVLEFLGLDTPGYSPEEPVETPQ